MKNILNLLSFLFIFHLNAQSTYNSSSIQVTLGDLQTNVCDIDSTANALIIYEKGNSYVHRETYKLNTKIEKKVKILNAEGFNKSTVEIYLYNSDDNKREEKIKNIVAATHNLENNQIFKTNIRESEIFREVYNKNNTIVKFTLPKIASGSVITYSYQIESPFMYNYKEWEFQEDIPKLYSEYNTSIPGNYEYSIKLVGGLGFSKKETVIEKKCLSGNNAVSVMGAVNTPTADCANTIYAMENIPAFIEEDFMTAKKNYLSRIDYELKTVTSFDGSKDRIARTWKEVDKELKGYSSLGRQLKKGNLVRDLLGAPISDETNPLEKAKKIYNYVQNNYTWNNEPLKLREAPIKDLIDSKSGNVSQINLLLHNLLIENDIESTPILLSTRGNGFATKLFPVISEFNYLITQATIDGKTYFLDATDVFLSFGQLPFRCLNDYGRLLTLKKGSSWIDIVNDKFSAVQHQVSLKFDEGNVLKGIMNSRFTDYYALDKKKDYFPNPESYVEDFENSLVDIEVVSHKVKDPDIDSDKFQEAFELEFIDLDTNTNTLYLNPFLGKFINSNPFQLQERTYPIEFGYKRAYMYNFQLDLGDKYELVELPKSTKMNLPDGTGECTFAINSLGNKVNISLKINIKKSRFDAEFYPSLKDFMSNIVNMQTNTLLALKKK